MTKVIRQGSKNDSEAIFTVAASAFRLQEGTDKWRRFQTEARDNPQLFRLLELDGQVVSVVRILTHRLRIGNSFIVKGDVGEVSTHPQFQGRGLMTELMTDCVRWMREMGHDISRLGGLIHFYSRFGYEPFPRRYVEFPLTPMRAGGSVRSPLELLAPPSHSRSSCERVRAYDPDLDAPWVEYLRWKFNETRTGSTISRTEAPPEPGAIESTRKPAEPGNALKLVYEGAGRVCGFVFASEREEQANETQGKIHIHDAAFDLSEPAAAPALVNRLLHTALERGCTRVTARLPFDPLLSEQLSGGGVRHRLVELHSSVASNMMRVINLQSTFRRIAPELTKRLRTSGWNSPDAQVRICLGDEAIALRVHRDAIDLSSAKNAECNLELSHAQMIKLVLGIATIDEFCLPCPSLTEEGVAMMRVLFPRQPTASGPWG